MSSPNRIPASALVLGCLGLLPFLAGAVALHLGSSHPGWSWPLIGEPRRALVIYAVAILSFLGGVRWGVALGYENQDQATRDYVLAVLPALVGWAAALLHAPADLWTLAGAFLLLGLLDYGMSCRTVAPEWYGNLRLALSGAVTLLLGAAAMA